MQRLVQLIREIERLQQAAQAYRVSIELWKGADRVSWWSPLSQISLRYAAVEDTAKALKEAHRDYKKIMSALIQSRQI